MSPIQHDRGDYVVFVTFRPHQHTYDDWHFRFRRLKDAAELTRIVGLRSRRLALWWYNERRIAKMFASQDKYVQFCRDNGAAYAVEAWPVL